MFSIFKKRSKNLVTDINWLGVDIHSHLLPGIDDGATDIEQSLGYIKRLENLGYEKLFCTPHIFTELYPNTPDTILPALQLVKDGITERNINIEVGAAAEYMTDETFKITNDLLCLPGKHILIEMSYLNETPNIEEIVFKLQVEGYKVILAHPERYNFYHNAFPRYQRLKEMGCLFQMNLLSITGYYGKHVKDTAIHLFEQKFYALAGTDLHHDKHLHVLEKVVINGQLYEAIGRYEFKNIELFD